MLLILHSILISSKGDNQMKNITQEIKKAFPKTNIMYNIIEAFLDMNGEVNILSDYPIHFDTLKDMDAHFA